MTCVTPTINRRSATAKRQPTSRRVGVGRRFGRSDRPRLKAGALFLLLLTLAAGAPDLGSLRTRFAQHLHTGGRIALGEALQFRVYHRIAVEPHLSAYLFPQEAKVLA